MFKLFLITVILHVNWGDTDTADDTIAYTLDFWSPNPKFDARRVAQDQKSINSNIKPNVRGRKLFYRYSRRSEAQNTSHKYRDRLHGRARLDRNPDHRERFKRTEPKNQRTTDTIDPWPKPRRIRFRSQDKIDDDCDDGAHSTRLTPMYLMQNEHTEPQKTVATQKPQTESTKPEQLSSYAIESQMRRLMSNTPEINVTMEVIGRTVEYNNIVLVKMSDQKTDIGRYFRAEESKYIEEVPEKRIVFIVHGLSVMGLPSLTTLNSEDYFKILLSYYTAHLDKFDIFLIPIANPDGYATAYHKYFWNKNMSPQRECAGVALDRNFDVAWNTGKSYSPCSQMYPGPSAFSEAETRAIRDVFHHYGHKIIAYIHVHPGAPSAEVFKGEAVLYPKGFTEIQSDDDKYIDLRGEIDEAMKNASFQVMSVTVDTLYNWYGKVGGTSVDYASTIYGIPYALEFVMQIYEVDYLVSASEEKIDHNALTEIWRRVIDVVFNNMWRNLHANDLK